MTYSDLAYEALENLKTLQESFRKDYHIDDYSHWFYNQSTELLRLYNASEEAYFKYIPVGTYSKSSKTWMWAWDNEDSVEQSKYDTLVLQHYGVDNDFEKLSNGYFDSDECDGWKFTALAHQFLGGIGGYKVTSDHLEIYFLIMEKKELHEVKAIEAKLIECEVHGEIRRAFICQHLNREVKTGFEEAFPTYRGMVLEEDDDFQAWCDECEKIRIQHDGWSDELMEFAEIKLVCERCYFEIKEFNTEEE
ncbi:DUF6882 domain-containing protein [Pontibacter ruber]|uniref:DUF6882 domain-containing protein n=1 Tax=Pontibacter ruber TaxID=1343895 RepID=A0ABW5CY93_9BACT|nr:DUF6882 domain-containing protein [Pontibacter ruber]